MYGYTVILVRWCDTDLKAYPMQVDQLYNISFYGLSAVALPFPPPTNNKARYEVTEYDDAQLSVNGCTCFYC